MSLLSAIIGGMAGTALESLAEAVRSSGLVDERSSGVALCSGGADSAALLAGLAGVCGPERVLALHLNYGLRPDSGEDERSCRELCERLGVELITERPELPTEGNLQAAARDARYARGRAPAPRARPRLDRHRAHPHRPGRDGPLPARHLAGPPGAARARAAPRPA